VFSKKNFKLINYGLKSLFINDFLNNLVTVDEIFLYSNNNSETKDKIQNMCNLINIKLEHSKKNIKIVNNIYNKIIFKENNKDIIKKYKTIKLNYLYIIYFLNKISEKFNK